MQIFTFCAMSEISCVLYELHQVTWRVSEGVMRNPGEPPGESDDQARLSRGVWTHRQ